jgi:hypothetical protein
MAILDRLVQNAYRIQRGGDSMHKNRDKTVCGTSEPDSAAHKATRPTAAILHRRGRRFVGFVPDWNTYSERRWRGGTDGSAGVMGYFQRPTCSRIPLE